MPVCEEPRTQKGLPRGSTANPSSETQDLTWKRESLPTLHFLPSNPMSGFLGLTATPGSTCGAWLKAALQARVGTALPTTRCSACR